jgi:hypothetical protein
MPKPITHPQLETELSFYQQQSEIISPSKYSTLFRDLPTDISELCGIVQNLLLHQFWILDKGNYGITVSELKEAGRDLNREINLRTVEEILDLAIQWDDRPLTRVRELETRVVGNCRDYSVLLVSMLRSHGVPARVRSGVARYFFPTEGHLEDHFICEFWNHTEGRWQQADAQIDSVQRKALCIAMNMADIPPDQFLNAGDAYAELKTGRVEPDKIGIFEYKGESYVLGKLISDLACVNSVEVLPWEGWGISVAIYAHTLSKENHALLKEIADALRGLTTDPGSYVRARGLFKTHPDLEMPTDYAPYFFELPAFG